MQTQKNNNHFIHFKHKFDQKGINESNIGNKECSK